MDALSVSSPVLSATPVTRRSSLSKPQICFTPWSHSISLKSRATKSPGVVAATTQTQEPSGDSMGFLLGERTIFLSSEIDDPVADSIITQLLLLDAQDPTKDIRLFINSYGGSMSATMAIYDVMQLVRADVSTVGLGMVASSAAIILGGGTKGKRITMPNTRIMIHQPLGGASGQAAQVEIQAREMVNSKNTSIRIISEFTGRPFDEIKTFIDVDQYMSATEAREYGIVDGIIDEERILPSQPVPEFMMGTINFFQMFPDPDKFLAPDIPDDEIY